MKLRVRLILLVAAPVMFLLSCSRPMEPAPPGGNVVLRIEPAAPLAPAMDDVAAAAFDSAVVRVFRGGAGVKQEVARGAPLNFDPIEISVPCIAENNKRVSVELYEDGVMTHYGVNTDVDVQAGRQTAVTVDAYPFQVSGVGVSPSVVGEGGTLEVVWPKVALATDYLVESSHASSFSTVDWSLATTDTFVDVQFAPGAHYFRVAPRTAYVLGSYAGPAFGYVKGASGNVRITGFSARGAIPDDSVSILGENLDFPGTQAFIGATPMTILSSSWDELVVEMPRNATTDKVTVGSLLGNDTSADPLIALRVAYVSATGQYAESFTDLMARYAKDIDESGVAKISIPDLDTRDMSVFDVIVVANDTGTDASDWGGGVTTRALTILSSGANVLAMGDGGLAFLQLTLPAYRLSITILSATSCYAPSPNIPVFQNPHSVIGTVLPGWVDICASSEREIGLQSPSGLTLYGATSVAANRWMLADQVVSGHRFLFWGFAADPKNFTTNGQDVMANVMYLLYH